MSTTHDHGRRVRPRRLAMLALAVVTGLATGLGGALVTETSASATTSQYGTLSAPSGYLPAANRCGTYTYRYDITPPPGDWALETAVIDPRGLAVSSFAVIGGYSPGGADATTSFTLCSNNTLPGVFTITGKLSTQTQDSQGQTVTTNYEMTPGTFTLTTAPVATTSQKAKNKKAKKRAQAKRAAKRKAELRKKRRLENRR